MLQAGHINFRLLKLTVRRILIYYCESREHDSLARKLLISYSHTDTYNGAFVYFADCMASYHAADRADALFSPPY